MNSPFLSNQKVFIQVSLRLIVWETLSMWVDLISQFAGEQDRGGERERKGQSVDPKD